MRSPPESRERVVRKVLEPGGEHAAERPAIESLFGLDGKDQGDSVGLGARSPGGWRTEEPCNHGRGERIRELARNLRELRWADEILRAAIYIHRGTRPDTA
jgi:hypothetical protein